jgi:hypothetical protein
MIQINYLSFDIKRIDFSFLSLDILKKIKKENKEKLKLILQITLWGDVTNEKERWLNKYEELLNNDIDTEIFFYNYTPTDYLNKIEFAVKSEHEYSVSMDEDVFISNYLWDYMIENVDILNNDEILFLSPTISNGIPSVDLFIDDFIDDQNIKNDFYNMFKNTFIPNMWGADYNTLNTNSNKWDSEQYYNNLNKINHHYKGIHPIRISYEQNYKLMEVIVNNIDKILNKQIYSIYKLIRPYYCNSFYFIKTNVWKQIINDKSLFRDVFDEVPLNLYKDKHNLKMGFVKNGFCIHMTYNSIPNSRYNIENKYIEKLKTIL